MTVRAPSKKRLVETFGITVEDADLIRAIAAAVDEPGSDPGAEGVALRPAEIGEAAPGTVAWDTSQNEPSRGRYATRSSRRVGGGNSRLEEIVEARCPETAKYARSCHNDPYATGIWRVTMALHAINDVVGGCGVEGLGPPRGGDYATPYEYVNMGDTYATTLIYKRDTDTLSIGDWGLCPRNPRAAAILGQWRAF